VASVDVVVPSYNYAHYLPGCVASLFSQQGVDVRVLVIDDASRDDTPAVAAQLLKQYPRLEYRRHQRNAGHIATYNEGLIAWASSTYVLLLSADDLLAPGALKRAADEMEQQRSVAMVCGMALLFESENDIASAPLARPKAHPGEPHTQVLSTTQLLRQCVIGNPIATPTAVVRTELQRAVGGYAPELPHTGDMEMWMRLALRGDVAVTRFVQAYKRLHVGNMSKDYLALRDLRQRHTAIEFASARDPHAYARRGLSREYVQRTMAEEALWLANDYLESGEREAVRESLDFAVNLWPAIVNSAVWRKTQLKQRLGRHLTAGLQTVAGFLRGSGRPGVRLRSPLPGTLQGWWPEPLARQSIARM
jgi:glycosyltransferase involved in cell wall biosynthesis